MDNVWIVVGRTGEYSDACEWNVAAFSNEEDALILKDKAQNYFNVIWNSCDSTDSINRMIHSQRQTNPYDPNMRVDYTGTKYKVVRVPFEG